MRRRSARLLLFLFVLAFWFVVFEAGLRRWGSSEAAPAFQGLFTGDPVVGYRLQPGARTHFVTAEFATDIAINGAGVRDDDEIGPKAPDEKRIVVLGDSLVLSVQVPFAATFTEHLERRLNEGNTGHGARRYRVINAGVQGYGPVEQLLFFRHLVGDLQPDVVLVTVFVGNDAEEAVTSQPKLAADRPRLERLRESLITQLRRTVRRSMVLQLLRLRIVTALGRYQTSAGPPEPPLQSYAEEPAPRIRQGFGLAKDAIAQVAAEAAAAGARTGIILMPARFQIDDEEYFRLREIVATAGGELRRDAATERFATALSELRLPMIDLLPPLRRASTEGNLFFKENVHLTRRGHAVVGDLLAGFVVSEGLLAR
jgi:hypothetical protein